MYEAYYGLTAKPFQLSPDPRFFFPSRGHQRAMAYLVYGAHQAEGFIVITGEVGAGKTLLARMIAEKLEARSHPAMAHVVSTQLGSEDTLRIVAGAFGLPVEGSKAVVLRNIEQFLLGCHKQGRRALLLIDEAQNLPLDSVEELRMLSNFQSGNKALLQSFLLGQPEFRRMLQSHALEQLRQRIIASCHLGPMDAAETERYIRHRLDMVGWRGDPAFVDNAFLAVYSYTGGIPRKINVLCDRLMLLGRLDEKHAFDCNDVAEVAEELRQQFCAPGLQPEAGVTG